MPRSIAALGFLSCLTFTASASANGILTDLGAAPRDGGGPVSRVTIGALNDAIDSGAIDANSDLGRSIRQAGYNLDGSRRRGGRAFRSTAAGFGESSAQGVPTPAAVLPGVALLAGLATRRRRAD